MASRKQPSQTKGDATYQAEPRQEARLRWISVAAAIAIVLAVLVSYWPAFSGDFLWDDNDYWINTLATHPTTRLIHANDGLFRMWFSTEADDYWPLTNSVFWVQWRLWGMDPRGYHATNILLHALGAIMLWRVLARLEVPGAWLGGLLFAIHPVAVASVAWISELKNVLSLLFFMATLLAWLRFEDTTQRKWYVLALTAFFLALTAKTSAVMLPVLLLGIAWWRRGSIRRQDVLRSAPFFVLSAAMGLATIWFQHQALERVIVRPEGWMSRLAATGWIVWFYLFNALMPVRLAMVYPRWQVIPGSVIAWIPLSGLIAVLALLWLNRATWWGRPLLAAIGYFLLMLAPVLGLLAMAFHQHSLVSDHLQYPALPAVTALAAAALVWWARSGKWRGVPVSLAIAVVLLSSALTWRRADVFQTPRSLWEDTLSKNPAALVAHVNLGVILWELRRPQEAVTHYEAALQIKADSAETHSNLGVALLALGRYEESIAHCNKALHLDPNLAAAHNTLAWLRATCPTSHFRNGEQALWHAKCAMQLGGEQNAWILGTRAAACAEAGRFEEAVSWQEKAIGLVPTPQQHDFRLRLELYKSRTPFRDKPLDTNQNRKQ